MKKRKSFKMGRNDKENKDFHNRMYYGFENETDFEGCEDFEEFLDEQDDEDDILISENF